MIELIIENFRCITTKFIVKNLPEDLQRIIQILNQPMKRENEVITLIPLISKIKFFMDNKIEPDDLHFICKKLKYEFVPRGNDVITFGDYGDKFYITLYGNVGVLIPMAKPKADASSAKPTAMQKTLIKK